MRAIISTDKKHQSRDYLLGELEKDLPTLLERYEGKPLAENRPDRFQKNGMAIYTNFGSFFQTDIGLTLSIDVTGAFAAYEKIKSETPGASFTLFLYWTWYQALQKVPGFNFRYINGQWYEFNNLPLYTTAIIDPDHHIVDNIVIDSPSKLTFATFCEQYRAKIAESKASGEVHMYPYSVYAVATHISRVNLPFTQVTIPTPRKGLEIERPMTVFGALARGNDGRLYIPLHAKLPHASLHPALFQQALAYWQAQFPEHTAQASSMMARL